MVRNQILKLCSTALLIFSLQAHAASEDDQLMVERIGDVGQIALPLTALAMPYLEKDMPATRTFALEYATTFTITHILKITVNETRPNGGDWSFPSGHTSSAFAGAASLQQRYGWKWGVPAYAAASYVGFSRVYAEKHWTHDVVAGAALAIGVNQYFAYRQRNKNLTITPFVDATASGLSLSAKW